MVACARGRGCAVAGRAAAAQEDSPAELRLFDDDEGHLAALHRESDILDELLTRG